MKINKILKDLMVLGIVIVPLNTNALVKKETIFTNLDYNGNISSTNVIQNKINFLEAEEKKDETTLKNIMNISGKDYKNDNNHLSWNDNNIIYRGEKEDNLPIKTTIKYYLNNEEVSPNKIVGKKGHIKVSINFENTSLNKVIINGKYEELYTPFVTTLGTTLNSKTDSNIKITNGKTIESSNKDFLIALASPGLSKSLNMTELESLNNITIEYDTNSFKLNNLYIISTPKLLSESDLDIFDRMDNIYSKVNLMSDSMNKLEEGSNKLKEGTYSLSNGISSLDEGITSIKDNTNLMINKLNESKNTLLNDKSNALDDNTLNIIKESAITNATLTNEQKEYIASSAKAKIEANLNPTSTEYKEIITTLETELTNKLNENKDLIYKKADEAISLKEKEIKAQADKEIDNLISTLKSYNITFGTTIMLDAKGNVTTTKEDAVTTKYVELEELSPTQYNKVVSALKLSAEENAIASAKAIAREVAFATIKNESLDIAKDIIANISTSTAKKVSVETADTISKEVASKVSVAVANNIANKVKEEASKKTASSLDTITSNLEKLSNGLSKVEDGTTKLKDGSKVLDEGMTSLNDGLKEFNNKGIKTIANYANNLKTTKDRIEALQNLSKGYNGYSCNNANETIFVSKVKSTNNL